MAILPTGKAKVKFHGGKFDGLSDIVPDPPKEKITKKGYTYKLDPGKKRGDVHAYTWIPKNPGKRPEIAD